ncbi:MAG: bifunctional phosphoribosyl-AMP cyclohydrolase/phosphoribosyl-ATP diphosphatase HisIE [Bacteroidales bacterium]|nr:bifunctional phosphoribosyl-AMP cyclohydrolase/phosphoribosyl-ATP diphosphatase HisIE [Bacteroidales bacterium]
MNSTIKTNFSIDELDFQKSGNSLIPAIIQDYTTLKVLMLGYMNREALEKTLDDKKVTFYSRSRERLWTKGESSGNFLFAREILKDCDNDTILIKAEAVGPTCHTGSNSCFNSSDDEGFIRKLQRVIERRKIERPQGSYTVELFDKGVNKIAQKVGEEAVETVIEAIDGNDERLIYEASDLIYHLLVLLACKNMNISDLEKELYKRHK